jgi:hypothetical protein
MQVDIGLFKIIRFLVTVWRDFTNAPEFIRKKTVRDLFREYKTRLCRLDVRAALSFLLIWKVLETAVPKDQLVSIDLAITGKTRK